MLQEWECLHLRDCHELETIISILEGVAAYHGTHIVPAETRELLLSGWQRDIAGLTCYPPWQPNLAYQRVYCNICITDGALCACAGTTARQSCAVRLLTVGMLSEAQFDGIGTSYILGDTVLHSLFEYKASYSTGKA